MNYHQLLSVFAYRKLMIMGYKTDLEVPLEKGIGRIDVFGFKKIYKNEEFSINNFRKVGIECLTDPNDIAVNKKIKKYQDYLDELIFCIFSDSKYKNNKIKIWKFPKRFYLESKYKIYEYVCNNCLVIFYTSKNASYCPFCKSEEFNINDTINGENYEVIKMPERYNNGKNQRLIILKNPKKIILNNQAL